MFDIIVTVGGLIITLVLSAVLLQGKGGFLIAGYNMLPKEQKEKIDTVNLCKFMGKITLGVSCSVALILAYIITEIEILNVIGLVILAISVVIALIWSNIHYMDQTRK